VTVGWAMALSLKVALAPSGLLVHVHA